MGGVRRHIRLGAGLALIALILQITLSFGHFHGLETPPAAVANLAAAASADLPDTAPDHDHRGAAAELCAVCVVVAMAGAILDASPPALPLRHADSARIAIADTGDPDSARPPHAFQPRGPPLS